MDEATLFWLTRILDDRMRERFFGKISFVFNDGTLVLAEIAQTLKPPRRDQPS